jgi:hypothetical protein
VNRKEASVIITSESCEMIMTMLNVLQRWRLSVRRQISVWATVNFVPYTFRSYVRSFARDAALNVSLHASSYVSESGIT